MRVLPAVEEDQVTSMRPDDRAIVLHCRYVGCARIMREDEFSACARGVIGAEEQAR